MVKISQSVINISIYYESKPFKKGQTLKFAKIIIFCKQTVAITAQLATKSKTVWPI
jgi:hypothetical protein